jgi:hypothetical protein
MAVSTVMLNQVEEWVRTPGSPNLYWALTNLPQPFVDLRKPMQGERLMLDNLMPGLREALADLKAPPMPVDKLQEMVAKLIQASGSRQPPPVLFVATLVAKKYGPAKEFLRQQGRTAEQIEAMPALQAVLMCDVAHYDRLFDEMLIVQGLPPETLLQAMVQFDRRLRDEVGRAGGPQGSVAFLLLPAVARVYSASVRLDRKINVLRCLEAIRLYAAAHGKLPDKLTDLEVPIPMDPMTGKPFDYRLDGGKAHMNATAPPGEPAHEWNTLRYEITLRR